MYVCISGRMYVCISGAYADVVTVVTSQRLNLLQGIK